jgi:fatty acid desaturase
MGKGPIAWMAGSVAAIILGFVLTTAASTAGTVLVVAGVVSLTGFLLYVFRHATTHDDQWVWQTPGKPRREYLADKAKHESKTER